MTSLSPIFPQINVLFIGDAIEIYEQNNLRPSTKGAVGIDLRAHLAPKEKIQILPGERQMIPTGLAIEPKTEGVAGFVYSRSGLGGIQGLTVAQGVGVIDPDYRGEIKVPLLNTSKEIHIIQRKDRIAQLVFQPFFRPIFNPVTSLESTERGSKGFGSTGR